MALFGNNDQPNEETTTATPDFGPYDADTVNFSDFDFSDFAKGGLDLGSMMIPVPHEGEVQVEMGANGPQMVHVLTPAGRLTPVAFAAPKQGSLWEESLPEVVQGMTNDGLTVSQVEGPWGEEIVATAGDGTMRVIGATGDRWMLRMTAAGPTDKAEELARFAREVMARAFVRRGNDPIPAGNVLPVTIPQAMAEELQKQIQEHNLAQARNAAQNPDATQNPDAGE
ncbi:DUF3710 domain-containing protein [Corynebacterium dentalis]|uniref:DUF3710 domain-containing protein n=1 Tax=Corynebacterium dentalis TaxID=2014528 RepID=UPI002899CCC6|nr:DUF3710 domain-containing protein [Corynebacterium dentalis]